ncbi:MAG TPA: hypothetical protein VGD77_14870, partial [Gemmatimonadaceae bacterium]
RVTITADALGTDTTRAWVGALSRAGAAIAWHADSALHPVALALDPLADPARAVSVAIAARVNTRTLLRDGSYVLDSLAWPARDSQPRGVVVPRPVATLGAGPGANATATGTGTATAALRDSLVLRPVLVAGRASWEARFVIAALEESGWQVSRRLTIAPGAVAQQASLPALDTASYSAVVLLDSAAAPLAPAAARFAQRGGGIVVAGTAARIPTLAPLLAARTGERVRPSLFESANAPRSAATGGYWPLAPVAGAVPLERVGAAVTVAARPVGTAGRLVQVGYDESWRWRLQGGDDAPAAHRRWWSRVVAGVARAPLVPLTGVPATSPAPLAELREALGAPSPEAPDERTLRGRARPDLRVLFGAILLLLLAEWGSRRLRGER